MKKKQKQEEREEEEESTKQNTRTSLQKFKWPKNLQDPKPIIKNKPLKTEITFVTYQIGKML